MRSLTILLTAIVLGQIPDLVPAQNEPVDKSVESVKLQPGDLVGMHIELSEEPSIPTTHLPTRAGLNPFIGFPFQVLDDGSIAPPYLKPQEVAGLTLKDAAKKIVESYRQDEIKARVYLSLIGSRTIEDMVDYRAQPGDVIGIDLPSIMGLSPPVFGMHDSNECPGFGYPFQVQDDGKVHFPYIDPLEATDKSLSEIRQLLIAELVREEVLVSDTQLQCTVSLLFQKQLDTPVQEELQAGDVVALVIEGITESRAAGKLLITSTSRDKSCGPTMGQPFQIDPEGNLDLPYAGKIHVVGNSVSQLQQLIKTAYVEKQILVEQTWIHAAMMEKYRLAENFEPIEVQPGDVLNIMVENLLMLGTEEEPGPPSAIVDGVTQKKIQVHFPSDESIPPSIGIPCLVHPDGTLIVPLLDPVPVSGLTIDQIKDELAERYASYGITQTFVQYYQRSDRK